MAAHIANTAPISGTPATKASPAETMRGIVAGALLVFAALSLATAQVPDCTPGKLSDYEKLGQQGCLIGDKKFSNFRYHQVADGLPSDSISLTPGTVPGSDDPALLIEAAWVAPSNQESSVSYTVEVQPKGKSISGATLEMQYGQITGTGKAMVFAELCPVAGDADHCGVPQLKLAVELDSTQPRKVMDSGELKTPLREVRVISPLTIATGKNGTASLNGFMTVFRSGTTQAFIPGESSTASSTGTLGQ
ncbi:MAG: hypothetical protein WCC87_18825 [Candidatus Korobacteraceae bacterium]